MNAAYWLLAAGSASGTATAAKTETTGDILGAAGMTALIGILVVFAMLVVLTVIFILFGKVVGRGNGQSTPKPAPAPTAAAPKASAPAPKPAPVVEAGIDDEVVAVIAAAVAAMAPAGKAYAVRRVSTARVGRSAWASAGLLDNTRPF